MMGPLVVRALVVVTVPEGVTRQELASLKALGVGAAEEAEVAVMPVELPVDVMEVGVGAAEVVTEVIEAMEATVLPVAAEGMEVVATVFGWWDL